MLSISIGPLAFPVAPLITLAAIWIGAIVAGKIAGEPNVAPAESHIWWAAIVGLIGARIGYLALHHNAYWQHPWSAFDIRDGGWLAWTGFLVGALWLAFKAVKHVDMRRSMIIGASVTTGIWLLANGAIFLSQSDQASAVPDVAVNSLSNGQRAQLPAVLRGKPAVVNLWATWCGPCRVEMPTLANAQTHHDDIRIVFVNQGEAPRTIQTYLDNEKLTLRNVWIDPNSALLGMVGSSGLPTTLFFDRHGDQVDAHFGVLSAASLAAKIDALR